MEEAPGRRLLGGHGNGVLSLTCLVLSDNTPVAISGGRDNTARVWDLHDGSQCGTLPGLAEEPRSVTCMSLADGTPVAVVRCLHGAIQMWDLRDHKLFGDFEADLFMASMVSVVLPDDTPVAVACDMDGSIEVVNLEYGRRGPNCAATPT